MRKSLIPKFLLVLILACVLFIGCGKKVQIWGDPSSGLILTYRMTENQPLSYKTMSRDAQTMEMMGQKMETNSSTDLKYTLTLEGLEETNLSLGVTVDEFKMNMKSGMMGEIKPDSKSVVGKTFNMLLSPKGKEVKVTGAEKLSYKMGMAGERNLKSSFNSILPDLPANPVKIGESWKSQENTTEKEGPFTLNFSLGFVNTLKALETINGKECVKILTEVGGTLKGKGQQMGSEMHIKAKIKGSSTWYFAYKEGVLVKKMDNTVTEGSVEVKAQNMTIPMKMGRKFEMVLQ